MTSIGGTGSARAPFFPRPPQTRRPVSLAKGKSSRLPLFLFFFFFSSWNEEVVAGSRRYRRRGAESGRLGTRLDAEDGDGGWNGTVPQTVYKGTKSIPPGVPRFVTKREFACFCGRESCRKWQLGGV